MFNIGDTVKLKTDLVVGKKYGNVTYLCNMGCFAHIPLEITNITNDKNYEVRDCYFVFSEEMLKLYDEKPTNPSTTHNFKIGDTVTIRKDLIPNIFYQGLIFVDGMSEYKGHTFKIKDIVKASSNTYILETLDDKQFWFTEAMFENLLNTKEIYDSKEYKSISEQIDKIKKIINSNKITITEVIINPCKKEVYTV